MALCAPNCSTHPIFATLMVDWLPANLDLFALRHAAGHPQRLVRRAPIRPRWLQHRLMPWVSWLLAAVSYWAVSHVVNDPAILYFIKPHVNLERQALYGIFALLIIAPAVFGPQDQSLIRRLLRSWPMASVGVISYGIYLHLNLIFQVLDWTKWRAGMVPFWLLALAVFALSVAVASVSYFGLERAHPPGQAPDELVGPRRKGGIPRGRQCRPKGLPPDARPMSATTVPEST